MSNGPCVDLSNARPDMWIYHRTEPHNNMAIANIFDVTFYNEKYEIGIEGIILRIPSKMNNEKYYDISFLPDGRQNAGGFLLGWHTIYPVTDKYRAIYEFEQEWQLNEKVRAQIP